MRIMGLVPFELAYFFTEVAAGNFLGSLGSRNPKFKP